MGWPLEATSGGRGGSLPGPKTTNHGGALQRTRSPTHVWSIQCLSPQLSSSSSNSKAYTSTGLRPTTPTRARALPRLASFALGTSRRGASRGKPRMLGCIFPPNPIMDFSQSPPTASCEVESGNLMEKRSTGTTIHFSTTQSKQARSKNKVRLIGADGVKHVRLNLGRISQIKGANRSANWAVNLPTPALDSLPPNAITI
ncbi:hypothetical protein K456DRAFT_1907661 [Colletotrichum gloeosporioides 23]|nr:hypothetical protein K456DRAFT_1907661 [Colletotrichum gloeosporioides 23]